MNITRTSPKFKELVSRLQSGELTRRQAADEYGINFGTLVVWLSREGLGDSTRMKTRPLHGSAALLRDSMDPERARLLDEAVQRVLNGTFKSCLSAKKEYPDVSLSTLTTRVRKARAARHTPD